MRRGASSATGPGAGVLCGREGLEVVVIGEEKNKQEGGKEE